MTTPKPAGRPTMYGAAQPKRSIRLDDARLAKAARIGRGKFTEGIRIALDAFPEVNLPQVPDPVPEALPGASPADT